jgi:glycosyltransferase involved in cell wall biosynthesis
MKILWFSWKDRQNPAAGGAELVKEELAARLAADGHEVIILTANFPSGLPDEIVNGYKIIRCGSRSAVYWHAFRYYRKNLIGWPDLVIDEMNTLPFFCKYFVREKNILFVHQLCREIWFYQMFFPLNFVGYCLEMIYLRLLNDRKVVTVSESTKKDLLKFGFKEENIQIIREGIAIPPIADLSLTPKDAQPTILSFGAIRKMKRVDEIIRAFERAKEKIPDLRLIVAGGGVGRYGRKVSRLMNESVYKDSIEYLGQVSQEKKREIMGQAHLLVAASVKEGWCLTVTEAGSRGTPAVAYNLDGLRDSIKNGETGWLTPENTPAALARTIVSALADQAEYEKRRHNAWQESLKYNFANSYQDFIKIIKGL